jgi:hypothetical protein
MSNLPKKNKGGVNKDIARQLKNVDFKILTAVVGTVWACALIGVAVFIVFYFQMVPTTVGLGPITFVQPTQTFTPVTTALLSPTPTSTLTPINVSPTFTETVLPTSTPEHAFIEGSIVDKLCKNTILPDYINPFNGIEQSITQIAETEARGEMFSLMGDYASIKLEFRNTIQGTDWIKLSNSVNISVTSDGNLEDKLNLRHVEGCGGGDYRFFSPDISLETSYPVYSVKAQNDEFDFFTLQPGEFESFDFNFYCKSPGIYTVSIELPYSLLDVSYNYTYTVPTKIICPKSYSLWNSYTAKMLEYGGDFIWDGEKYAPSK